jgi:outer membrane lipoprotein-sorting protein
MTEAKPGRFWPTPPILRKKDFSNVRIIMRDKILFLLAAFLFFLYSLPHALTSEQLAQKIEANYRSFEDISMEFVQLIESPVFSDTQKVWGKMYLKNPDRFKIQTEGEVITTDGETLWVFSQKNKQVRKSLIDKSKRIFKPNQYLYNFRENYSPELSKERKIENTWFYVLTLSPRKNQGEEGEKDQLFINDLTLWVDKKNFLVRKLKYQDLNDNLVSFIFSKIKTNSKIKDSEFIFNTPKGIEIVDLTE